MARAGPRPPTPCATAGRARSRHLRDAHYRGARLGPRRGLRLSSRRAGGLGAAGAPAGGGRGRAVLPCPAGTAPSRTADDNGEAADEGAEGSEMTASDVLAVVAGDGRDHARRPARRALVLFAAHAPGAPRDASTAPATKRSVARRRRSDAVATRKTEVDRVERLVTRGRERSRRRVSRSRSRRPVVKAMAFGTGVSRAAQRCAKASRTPRRVAEGAPETRRSMFKRLVWLIIGVRGSALGVVVGADAAHAERRPAARAGRGRGPLERQREGRGARGSRRDAAPAKRAETETSERAAPAVAWQSMPDRPTTADELARAFIDFFVERGHTHVPVGERDPGRPDLAFTIAGMIPFKPYFTGEETPPYKRARRRRSACAPAASTTTSTTSAARTATSRSSRCSATSASATTSRPTRSRGRGSSSPRCCGLDPDRLWVTVHEDDDEAERIWRDAVGFPPSGSSASARTTSGAWATPAVRSVVGDLLGPRPEHGPDGGPATERGPLHRDLEPRVHAVRPAGRRHARRRCRSRASTPAPARAHPRGAAGQGLDLGHRRVPAADRGGRAGTGVEYGGFPGNERMFRCGSSRNTRARSRS